MTVLARSAHRYVAANSPRILTTANESPERIPIVEQAQCHHVGPCLQATLQEELERSETDCQTGLGFRPTDLRRHTSPRGRCRPTAEARRRPRPLPELVSPKLSTESVE